MAIRGFSRQVVQDFFLTGRPPRREGWAALGAIVRRKLDMLDYATSLEDLRSPPGNRLETLRGDQAGRFSIRVNEQWRITFGWTPEGPDAVNVEDYH